MRSYKDFSNLRSVSIAGATVGADLHRGGVMSPLAVTSTVSSPVTPPCSVLIDEVVVV